MKKILKPIKNKNGQGLIEYLIIVAIVAVASIGIMRTMGQTVTAQFANVTLALQGRESNIRANAVRETDHRKKDLGDFFNGAAKNDENNHGQ